MEEIEVVIKIPRILYAQIQSDAEIMIYSGMRSWKGVLATLLRSVRNGTPLPKGHGRLIDSNELIKSMDNNYDKFGYSARYGLERLSKDDKEYVPYVRYGNMVIAVNKAPTIIEADKLENEEA